MIHFLLRIIPHYRIAVLEKVLQRLNNIEVYYGNKQKYGLIENVDLSSKKGYFKLNNYHLFKDKVFLSAYWSVFFKKKPSVIINVFNIGNLNLYILFFLRLFFKTRIILWSFGYDPFAGFKPKDRFVDKIRLWMYQKADAVIFYWEYGKKVVSEYSKKTNHYFVAPNTIDTDLQTEIRKKLEKQSKEQIKNDLGIKSKHFFVFSGRLIPDKQVDYLLRAFKNISDKNIDVSLVIIGKGPENDKLRLLVNDLKINNVIFKGEIIDPELVGKYLYVSEALVMPGRLGNAVVHSFCFGTPVISFNKSYFYHGEGIGYLHDNKNGLLANDNDIESLSEKMIYILNNAGERLKMSQEAILTVENECSIDKMAEGIINAIKFCE